MPKLASIFLTIFMFSLHLKAQQVVIAGKSYTVHQFDTDTVDINKGFAVESKVLPPIRTSPYDLDIRVHVGNVWLSEPQTLLCIQGNQDSLVATAYKIHLYIAPQPSNQYHKISIDSTHYLFYKVQRITGTQALHTLLSRLIKHRFFNLKDEMTIVEAFRTIGIQPTGYAVMDAYANNLVEIKLQGKYHSFYYNEQNHTLYPKRKELAWNRKVGEDIHKLLKLIPD